MFKGKGDETDYDKMIRIKREREVADFNKADNQKG